MNIIFGNLLDIKEGVITHQANCKLKAGSGLALQIRNKWPDWYEYFLSYKSPKLGDVTYFEVEPNLWVASLYAQDGFGWDKRYTDYDAFRKCLQGVAFISFRRQVYIPEKIGCGLAGGNWNIISSIIGEELPKATIVKLNESNN